MNFENKVALVTGAASGMGLLTSRCFAAQGAKVAMVDVNAEQLQKCTEELKAAGGVCCGIAADVRDYAQVTAACDKAVQQLGSLDILMNVAGGAATRILKSPGRSFTETPIEVYNWGMDVNFKGPFYFAHAAMKHMERQNSGVIVNVGSITGEEGCALNVDYSASKSGVMYGLTKSLALAGAPHNIRCCCVSPGPVLTRPGMVAMNTLEGRAADPQEIVDLILYVASEKGRFINGVNFLIDGGRNIMRGKN